MNQVEKKYIHLVLVTLLTSVDRVVCSSFLVEKELISFSIQKTSISGGERSDSAEVSTESGSSPSQIHLCRVCLNRYNESVLSQKCLPSKGWLLIT